MPVFFKLFINRKIERQNRNINRFSSSYNRFLGNYVVDYLTMISCFFRVLRVRSLRIWRVFIIFGIDHRALPYAI